MSVFEISILYAMAPAQPVDQLAQSEAGFALGDENENDANRMSSLGDVFLRVGRTLPTQLAGIYEGPGGSDVRVSFDGSLGNPSTAHVCRDALDEWADLRFSFAAFDDDGTGYIPLFDLMLAFDIHVKGDSGWHVNRNLSDDQWFAIFCQTLDVGMLDSDSAKMDPEDMWKIVTQEFNDLRREQKKQNVDVGIVWCPVGMTASTYQSSDHNGRGRGGGRPGHDVARPNHVLNVTMVDISGESVMSFNVVPTCLVRELKQQIQKATGLPGRRQVLILAGQVLSPEDGTLLEAGFWDGASLTLAVRRELKVDYVKFADKLMDYL